MQSSVSLFFHTEYVIDVFECFYSLNSKEEYSKVSLKLYNHAHETSHVMFSLKLH